MIGTLSGGQKSRVAFAVLSLQRPHVLLLDEVCCLIEFHLARANPCLAYQSSRY